MRKKIGANPFVPKSEVIKEMHRRIVAQALLEREAKATKLSGGSESSAAPPKKKQKIAPAAKDPSPTGAVKLRRSQKMQLLCLLFLPLNPST